MQAWFWWLLSFLQSNISNPVLDCECDVGLFPCSLSLSRGLHLESQLRSLDHTTLWEDNHTLPRTISWFTQARLVLGGFHAGFAGPQSYGKREIRQQQQTQVGLHNACTVEGWFLASGKTETWESEVWKIWNLWVTEICFFWFILSFFAHPPSLAEDRSVRYSVACKSLVCVGEECYLVVLQRSGVEGPAQEKLSYHTAQWPHVDGLTKRQTQNNLWSPAEKNKNKGSRKGYMWELVTMYNQKPVTLSWLKGSEG